MKFTISQLQLQKALGLASSVLAKKTTPMLGCFELVASSDKLTICATDLGREYKITLDNTVDSTGQAIVDGERLLKLVKATRAGSSMRFNLPGNHLNIACEQNKHRIKIYQNDKENEQAVFPRFDSNELKRASITVKSEELKQALSRVECFVGDKNLGRDVFNGMHFKLESGTLTLTSTNSHCLSCYSFAPMMADSQDFYECVLRLTSINEIKKLLEEDDINIKLDFYDSKIVVHANNVCFTSQLIDDKYPNVWKALQMASENKDTKVTLSKSDLLEQLKIVSFLHGNKFNRVDFEFTGKTLNIQSTSPDMDASHGSMEADIEGQEMTIAFNCNYLFKALYSTPTNTVILNLKNSLSPCFMTPDDCSHEMLISPMRV